MHKERTAIVGVVLLVGVLLTQSKLHPPIALEALPVALFALTGLLVLAGALRFLGIPKLVAWNKERKRRPRVREIWVPKREPSASFAQEIYEEDTEEATDLVVLQLPPSTAIRKCVVCGVSLEGRKANAKFCSAKCRKNWWTQKQEGAKVEG